MNIIIDEKINGRQLIFDEDISKYTEDEKYYECRMITGNTIPVFLSCKTNTLDELEKLTYDISSMISLSDRARKKHLNYEELRMLVLSLSEAMETVEEYLLSQSGVLLKPEYIYYDPGTHRIRFCYFPWNPQEVFSSYTELSEFLLKEVDYDDKEAVDKAYEIYASVLNRDYNLNKIIGEGGSKFTNNSETGMMERTIVEELARNYAIEDTSKISDYKKCIEKNNYYKIDSEEKQELCINSNNEYKKTGVPVRLSSFSVICLTLLTVCFIAIGILYIYKRNIFIELFSNLRIVSSAVAGITILLYFPMMNISDIVRAKRRMHRE